MNRIEYWIHKALSRAQATPNRGGEILYACFRELLVEQMKDAERVINELQTERDRLRRALLECRQRPQDAELIATDALTVPDTELDQKTAPDAEVIPLRKENA